MTYSNIVKAFICSIGPTSTFHFQNLIGIGRLEKGNSMSYIILIVQFVKFR